MTQPWEYDALEDLARRVERMGYGPEREKAEKDLAERRRKKALKRKRRPSSRKKPQWAKPRMREIIRAYPQGKTLTRIPTDDAPMSRREYQAYLATDYWRQFVEDYKADSQVEHKCFVCGNANYELHHRTYVRLGQEQFEDVVPLCREHHEDVHRAVKAGRPLGVAHLYVRERFIRGELGIRSK